MTTNKIRNVLILGAGTMGLQIGLVSAISGFDVIIYDAFEKALKQAGQRMKKLAEALVKHGRIDPEKGSSLLRWGHYLCPLLHGSRAAGSPGENGFYSSIIRCSFEHG